MRCRRREGGGEKEEEEGKIEGERMRKKERGRKGSKSLKTKSK